MGDISAEPSMEEILSSIKRIIAEEGDAAVATRARRGRTPPTPKPAPFDIEEDERDEILELSQPVSEEVRQESPMAMGAPTPPEAQRMAPPQSEPQPAPAEPILSERAAEATRGPLEALSRMVVKPSVPGSDTLEGLVREMIKPMLRDWLDANLPQVVEEMVAREISRITGRSG